LINLTFACLSDVCVLLSALALLTAVLLFRLFGFLNFYYLFRQTFLAVFNALSSVAADWHGSQSS